MPEGNNTKYIHSGDTIIGQAQVADKRQKSVRNLPAAVICQSSNALWGPLKLHDSPNVSKP